uniref:Uncharacterized protein n=1 Tax=Anguilla anguilla TaxID=7936 RepID=A0A0E9TJT9_ANGAN
MFSFPALKVLRLFLLLRLPVKNTA